MFIAIEGIDGAGKTSVAKIIAKRLNYNYSSQKALSQYMEIDESVYLSYCTNYRNNVDSDKNKMFWLYATSCLLAADISNVVCDRHLGTVYFWYGCDDNEIISHAVYSLSKKPDITFLLNVSVQKALERVRSKFNDEDIETAMYKREIEKANMADKFSLKVEEYFQKFNLPYKILETDNMTIPEVADGILSYVSSMKIATEVIK